MNREEREMILTNTKGRFRGLLIGQLAIVPYFKWFDFWQGFYWDHKNKVLYYGYFPMCGVMFYRDNRNV